jgi:hypothetical protein
MKSDREALKQELEEQKAGSKAAKKRTPPTSEQIKAEQKRQAEADLVKRKAALPAAPATSVPAKAAPTAVAMPDNRTTPEVYADNVSPSFMPGPLVKFDGKEGHFILASSGDPLDQMKRYIARLPDMWVGWIKFNGEGEPPSRVGGLLYDGYVMPPREALGDTDESNWPLGYGDKKPTDPWLHQQLIPIQDAGTWEILTFGTTNPTGRTAVGALLRAYNRMRRANPNDVPIIQLVPSSYQHREFGKVNIPRFVICGKTKYDAITEPEPELSLGDDLNDKIPF